MTAKGWPQSGRARIGTVVGLAACVRRRGPPRASVPPTHHSDATPSPRPRTQGGGARGMIAPKAVNCSPDKSVRDFNGLLPCLTSEEVA